MRSFHAAPNRAVIGAHGPHGLQSLVYTHRGALASRSRASARPVPRTHLLRRDEDDVPLLDHELAQRGLLLKDLVAAGVSWMTLQRLRRGEATTPATAHTIAAVLDPKHPEAMVKRLFEVKRRPRGRPRGRAGQAQAAGTARSDET